MNLTSNYNSKFSRDNFNNILTQNKKCMKYITNIQHNCLIPEKIKKKCIQTLIKVLERNNNFLDAYFYTIDTQMYYKNIINDDFNKELKLLINKEMNKISYFLDTIQYFSTFI